MANEVSNQTDTQSNESEPTKKCPFCAETIKAEAIVCRYCGRDLTPKPKPKHVSSPTQTTFRGSSGARILAIIGVICGIVGFFAFGLPLGGIAVLCGIISLAMGAGFGAVSIIVGVIDILVAIFLMGQLLQ